MINIYKNIDKNKLFILRNNAVLRGNSKTICIPSSNCVIKQNSFSARSVQEWNSLPDHVVTSNNLNMFKRKIDDYFLQN